MKTGLFKENTSQDYVLLLDGKEIARYSSVKDFVDEQVLEWNHKFKQNNATQTNKKFKLEVDVKIIVQPKNL